MTFHIKIPLNIRLVISIIVNFMTGAENRPNLYLFQVMIYLLIDLFVLRNLKKIALFKVVGIIRRLKNCIFQNIRLMIVEAYFEPKRKNKIQAIGKVEEV